MTKKWQRIYLAAAWIAGLIQVTLFWLHDLSELISHNSQRAKFGVLFFSLALVVPLALLFACTIAMLLTFLRNEQGSDLNQMGSTSNRRDQRKVVKMISLMTFGYAITCCPYVATFAVLYTKGVRLTEATTMTVFQSITSGLLNFISVVDIVVYSIFDVSFRNHVTEICRKYFD